jgi:hypothetical protein
MQKRYFTGKPCKKGHIAERFKSNHWCVECASLNNARQNTKLREETKRRKEISPRNLARMSGELTYEGKPCKNCSGTLRQTSVGACVQCLARQHKQYRERNPRKRAFWESMRRIKTTQATPSWVNRKALKTFYENCPEGYHVDHIVPLKGKYVCGLNVIWNLQYLTVSENCRKGNRF